MSSLPPVPQPINTAPPAQQAGPISFGVGSDPVESPNTLNTLTTDNKKLEMLSFEHDSKVTIFYFGLSAAGVLFTVGCLLFFYMSHRMFGWQTILILFAFFAPATIIIVAMIRAVYASLAADKATASSEDVAVPNLTACKELLEIVKNLR